MATRNDTALLHSRRQVLAAGAAASLTLAGCASPGNMGRAGGLGLSARELADLIAKGDISAERVASEHLDAIERVNPRIKAFAWIDRAATLEQARSVDQEIRRNARLGPLAGVPMAVKDNIDTLGFPTSNGTPSLRKNFPQENAAVVQRLYSQGAILLGKTNMHELAFGGTSNNAHFGAVRNPYDPTRIAGGSSGGTAAALAARLAPIGLGTDTAGSVRIPAAFSGVAGFRPTRFGGVGEYPLHGVAPLVYDLDTVGPLGTRVDDMNFLHEAITGRRVPAVTLRGLRLGVPDTFLWENIDEDVLAVARRARALLTEQGVQFVPVPTKSLNDVGNKIYGELFANGVWADLETYLSTRMPELSLQELGRQIAGADMRQRLGSWKPADPIIAVRARQQLPRVHAAYRALFKEHGIDALVFPTEPLVAPKIQETGDTLDAKLDVGGVSVNYSFITVRHTRIAAGLGLPGVNVPAGLSTAGLPVGLEFDGLPNSDLKLLGIAAAVEKAVGVVPAPRIHA